MRTPTKTTTTTMKQVKVHKLVSISLQQAPEAHEKAESRELRIGCNCGVKGDT